MIDKPITSKLANLLYDVYEVPYLTCLTTQEYEEKAKAFDIIKNKRVDVRYIIEEKPTRGEYNAYIWLKGYSFDTLDEEEFDVVNEVFGNE